MSNFLQTGVAIGASIGGELVSAFFSPKRSINSQLGSFHLYVTLEERHHDELVITDHPVEQQPSLDRIASIRQLLAQHVQRSTDASEVPHPVQYFDREAEVQQHADPVVEHDDGCEDGKLAYRHAELS